MNPKTILAWTLVGLGVLFLITGLVITVFATLPQTASLNSEEAVPAAMWVEFANQIMDFIVQMMAVDWTPTRVGIFLIIIGMILEGFGAYTLMSTA